MVLAAGALELALQNAEGVRVIVDALMIGAWFCTVSQPRAARPASLCRRGDRLLKALRVLDVVSFRILGEELVGVLEVQHHVQADLRVGLVEPIQHREEGVVESRQIERHILGADADRLMPASANGPSQAAIFKLFSTIASPPDIRISRRSRPTEPVGYTNMAMATIGRSATPTRGSLSGTW